MTITTLHPDTCGCTLHYSWDETVDASVRVHTPVDTVTTWDGKVLPAVKCAIHAGAVDAVAHHAVVLDENNRKNKIYTDLLAAYPNLVGKLDANGNTVLKDGIISWSFDQNRNVLITVKGATANQITLAQTAANTKFGAGKVVISAG